jgi:DNA-binding CsgD family transcriptional regulator
MRIATLRETVRLYAGQRPDLELMERAADSALAEGDLEAPGRVSNVYKARLAFGGARPALDFLLDRIGRVHAIGMGSPAHDLRAEAAQAAIYAGDFRAAVTLADFVLERPASFRARHQAAVRRADALTYLGDFDLARASVELAAGAMHGDLADKGERLMTELEMAYWSGATERAAELADELTELGAGSLANLALPLLTGAWADLDLGRPLRDVPLVDFPALAGLPLEVQGINHLATGAFDDAAARFDQAAEAWASYITPRELVCRWATGESLRRAGDTAEAVERLQVSLGRAEEIGFEPLAARARRSLRMAGVRVSASPRGSAGDGIALSRRETELVRLVEQGLSNIEIARRLGLGRPTVARMMASAMGKLGVDRRAQLAARELV